MMPASSARRSNAVPGCPVEASQIACTARPGGVQRSHRSTPPKLAAVSAPSEASFGTIWMKPSYTAKIGMISRAAKSLPRRERSIPASPVVTNRASVMQNSTCSTHREQRDEHAERAAGQPDGHPEQAEQSGRRPGARGRGGQQAYRERAGAERVEGQRGGVQGAVEAEDDERQDQPREPEHVKITVVRSAAAMPPPRMDSR